MKRILFIYTLLLSMTAFAFSTERYQVSTDCINARRYPNTSAPVLFKYKNGEVVAICEYKTAGNYTWGRIAGANPPQWVAMNYLEKLPDLPKKESKVASRFSWAHFNPQLADKPYYVRLYWLTPLAVTRDRESKLIGYFSKRRSTYTVPRLFFLSITYGQ